MSHAGRDVEIEAVAQPRALRGRAAGVRPRAVQQARDAERSGRLLHSIIENMPAVLFLKDAQTLRYARVNRACEELLGLSRDKVLGLRDAEIFPGGAAGFEAADRRVLGEGVAVDIPEEAIQGRAGLRRMHTKKVPLLDAHGRPEYLLGISEDITERKELDTQKEQLLAREQTYRQEAEAAQLQAERATARLRAVLAISEVALGKLELDELLQNVLPRIRDVFAVDTVAILLLSEDGAELRLRGALGLDEALRQGLHFPSDRGLAGRTLKDQKATIVDDIRAVDLASPILKEAGVESIISVPMRVEGWATGVLHVGSLTPRRFSQNEATLLQLIADRIAIAADRASSLDRERAERQRAQQAVRARDELVAVVSHDLRNPLNAISLAATVLQARLPANDESPRLRQHAETIQRAAQRMNRLIGDLLDAAKIEAKGLSIERSPTDAAALVAEANEVLHVLAEQKSLALLQRIEPGVPAVLCDRARVVQVLSNLVGNAIKFTPEGGRIAVRAERSGSVVLFSVSDTGPGLSEDELPHLFERYWQAKRTANAGSGLGLYIAKGIVEAHGGRMWVDARPGAGATFFFTLPTVEHAEDQPAA